MSNDELRTGESREQTGSDKLAVDRRTAMKGGLAGLGLLALGGLASGSAVAASGANKVYLADGNLQGMSLAKSDEASDAIVLSQGVFKTSTNTDLIIQASVESGLYTKVKGKGDSSSSAEATVECWVEIDGNPVPYPAYDGSEDGNNGAIVFNNREFGLEMSNFGDLEAEIELFIRTRSANAFNWYTANVGQGEHTVALMGRISDETSGYSAEAEALVGPRTLIVEPVNMSS
jgi:hypothetical protein